MNLRTAFFLASSFLMLFPCKSSSASGYNAVISCEDGFLAAGAQGRIDWISTSGYITKSERFPPVAFNSLLSFGQTVFVAGDSGVILVSTNKSAFRKVESGTKKNILSLALFHERILAGSEQGELLIGDEKGLFRSIQLNLKGNIVSLSVRTSDCYGATDQGEIIHTTDGVNWTVFDFNEYYSGYYKPCRFTRILAMDHQIAVAGKQDDGSPVLMFSTQGTIWSERTLSYTDDEGLLSSLTEIPNDLFYDVSEDQLILVSNKGKMMKIPSCSHCNKFMELSTEDLRGVNGNGNTWMVVGSHFFIKAMDANSL